WMNSATPAHAQIYDSLDLAKFRTPESLFQGLHYLTPEFLDDFISGKYGVSSIAKKYRERLENTLLPNIATQSEDLLFQNDLAAAYIWTDQPIKAIEILKPLSELSIQQTGSFYFDLQWNLATAYERAGLNRQALEVAQRVGAMRGKLLS